MTTPKPFLMFQNGVAQQALDLYVATFPESRIVRIEHYGQGESGPAGTIKVATFTLGGREFMCSDSPVNHAFSFTPSSSIFVECESMESLETIAASLSSGGQYLMPPGNYGFSRHFCWFNDRFGVSWQLNLAS